MKAINFFILICSIALLIGCVDEKTNQPPEHQMIEQAYFKCERCKSIEGGIYGKGPFKKLHSKEAERCIHDWVRIDKEEFRKLGAQWYRVKWEDEIPWWTNE